jgi:hypothetical protein
LYEFFFSTTFYCRKEASLELLTKKKIIRMAQKWGKKLFQFHKTIESKKKENSEEKKQLNHLRICCC